MAQIEPRANRAWLFTTLAALLPLIEVATLLVYRWSSIPARFPTHWGIDGRANGWSTRTPAGVFTPLILGSVLVLGFALLGESMPRLSTGFNNRVTNRRLTRNILRATAWFLALLFSTIGLLPLVSDPTHMVPWLVAGPLVFAVVLIAWIVFRCTRLSKEMTSTHDPDADRYWKAGLFYCNPDDPALMVPKRIGIGYTFNFGHPITWILLGGFAALPLIASLLPLLSKH